MFRLCTKVPLKSCFGKLGPKTTVMQLATGTLRLLTHPSTCPPVGWWKEMDKM